MLNTFYGVWMRIYLLILQLGSHGSNLTEEELETHTISAWKEAKSYHNRQINQCARACPRQLVHVSVRFYTNNQCGFHTV